MPAPLESVCPPVASSAESVRRTPCEVSSQGAERERVVLLVGHGSRRAGANAELRTLAQDYARLRPTARVETAFLELEPPGLDEAIDRVAQPGNDVLLAPVFLFAAGHIKNDLPLALDAARTRHPETRFASARPFGAHPKLLEVAHQRSLDALGEPRDLADTVLLAVGRGSSDPEANAEFYKVARLLAESTRFEHTEPAFLGVAEPSVPNALDRLARMRPKRIVVFPYLLFAGRLVETLRARLDAFRQRYTWIDVRLAEVLGHGPALVEALDERVGEALDGGGALPCDLCHYRGALPGMKDEVGGLRALLYSVRHSFTHAQAAMPEHTHRPLKKHVLVCTNADCADRGSLQLVDAFRHAVKAAGQSRAIKVTRTSCMGRCGGGPTVAVYPDGIWYRRVQVEDAREIVHEHLLGDRLVGRLVDDILQ